MALSSKPGSFPVVPRASMRVAGVSGGLGDRSSVTLLPDPSQRELWCPIISGDEHVLEGFDLFIGRVPSFSKDYSFVSVSEQASGDSYALEWEMVGTNTGEAGGLPATNKPYRIRGVSVGRIDADGRIKLNRDYWNMADYLMQVGILPPPSSPRAGPLRWLES